MNRQFSLTLLLVLSAHTASAQSKSNTSIRFVDSTFVADDSSRVAAQFGLLPVRENRTVASSRTIRLNVVRFKASSAARAGSPPIVYLAGGPGSPGTISASGARFPLFMAMRDAGDVVVLDQRGTLGESNTVCPERVPLVVDTASTPTQMAQRFAPWMRRCADVMATRGFDLRGYNTIENAQDLEELRIALGAERLSLVGISYGTHLALAYARAYPNRVHRMVLAGTEGPDHTYKMPSTVQRVMARIDSTYLAETGDAPANSISARLGRLRAQLAAQPARVTVTAGGRAVEVEVGPTELDLLAFGATGNRSGIAQLSPLLNASLGGNYQFIAGALVRESQRGARAMLFAMDCASGISPTRAAQLRQEENAIPLGGVVNVPMPAACDGVPFRALDDTFRSPVRGEMPVLFISGDLDTRTPVEHAIEVAAGFPRAQHLIIRGASHDNDLFISDVAIGQNIVSFLNGGAAQASIQLPPLFTRR